MSMTKTEVAQHVKESLKLVPLGKTKDDIEVARTFYKFMFTEFPDLRKYFKGAENFTAEDVQKSERFEKQGQRILLAVYILANTFEDEATFRSYARETVNRHRQFKMEPALWLAFFTVYIKFLESHGTVTADQKKAWNQLGEVFNDECQEHLKACNLPHC